MQAILLIVFMVLFFFMYKICSYAYDPYEATFQWYQFRDKLYGVMFLIAVIMPWFKTTLFSRALMVFGIVLTAANIVDRVVFNIYETLDRDWFIIIPFAAAAGYLYYEKRNK